MNLSLLLLAGSAPAFAQDTGRWDHESESQEVYLHDFVELWNGSEFDTGWVPSGSPLQLRFQIQSSGGAEVEMEGVGNMGWPEGLTVALDPIVNSGEIVVDAALEAVTSIKFDVDIYSYEAEIDRRGFEVEGETTFSPFLLSGDVPSSVEVYYEGETLDLLDWYFQVFTGVTAGVSVDLGPQATTTFNGENWYVEGERLDVTGQEAWVEPLGEAYQNVDIEYVAHWTSGLDLVLNPVFEVCVDIVGCWDIADIDIPIPLASDDFDQFFPTTTLAFPLPVMGDLPARHDYGTIDIGASAVLELPLENIGALDLEGTAFIDGSGYFSVYPEYFQAGPGMTDGVVVSFTPGAEGDFEATLVLQSNDPLEPTIEIPLLATGMLPYSSSGGTGSNDGSATGQGGSGQGNGSRAQPQIVRTETGGCSCSTPGASPNPAGWAALLLGGLALLRRRENT